MRVSLQREEVIGRRLRYRGHGSGCSHTREVKELVLHTGCGFQTQVFDVLMPQSIQKAKEATVLLGELYHHPFAPSLDCEANVPSCDGQTPGNPRFRIPANIS